MHTLHEIQKNITYNSAIGTTVASSFWTQVLNLISQYTGLVVENNKVFFDNNKTIGLMLSDANNTSMRVQTFCNYNGESFTEIYNDTWSVSTTSTVVLVMHRSTNETVTTIGITTTTNPVTPYRIFYAENNEGIGTLWTFKAKSGNASQMQTGTTDCSQKFNTYIGGMSCDGAVGSHGHFACTKMPDAYHSSVFPELYLVTATPTNAQLIDQLVQFNDGIYHFAPAAFDSFTYGAFAFPVSDPA